MKATKAGLLYFALVFGAGFALGAIRVLWLVPKVGDRAAELMESPVMLAVIVLAARGVTKRLAVPAAAGSRLAMGFIGLALTLAAEFGLVLWLRGITLEDYFDGRDPVTALVYYALLGVFALTPLLLAAMKGRDRTD